MHRLASSLILVFLFACGGGNGDGGDGGPTPDSRPNAGGECRAGGMATSDGYQPLAVGNIWLYDVTEVGTGNPPFVKQIEMTETITPEGETEPVVVQVTTKSTGRTVSWFRTMGESVARLRQEDYDPQGLLERTTVYEPYKLRLDESLERLMEGASYDETYTNVVYDPQGVELQRVDIVDHWVIVSMDTPCTTGWGEELSCVHAHRERLLGGVSIKDYYFARGYGKVREEGGQLELLSDCTLQ